MWITWNRTLFSRTFLINCCESLCSSDSTSPNWNAYFFSHPDLHFSLCFHFNKWHQLLKFGIICNIFAILCVSFPYPVYLQMFLIYPFKYPNIHLSILIVKNVEDILMLGLTNWPFFLQSCVPLINSYCSWNAISVMENISYHLVAYSIFLLY